MPMWNPWRGCHRYSEGCLHCYIHKGDAKRGVDTNIIVKTDGIRAPLDTLKKGAHAGEYKMKSGETVYLCFSSDFLLPDADEWRGECWEIIKSRPDLKFIFLTKRIERFAGCIPSDWGDGYDNVTVGCTIENEEAAKIRLPVFDVLPIKHKNIILQPLIDGVSLKGHLDGVELVIVGGESDKDARPLDYHWVMSVRGECIQSGVPFQFRQTGSKFIKDGTLYNISAYKQFSQARAAGLDLCAENQST